jgi:hypothetical protein
MNIDAISVINRDHVGLAIAEARFEALRIEVEQFTRASEAVRNRLEFDLEPSGFVAAIAETAVDRRHA